MADINPGDEDRDFDARTILAQHGVHLEMFRPFTLEQVEALAEIVKSWDLGASQEHREG